mmetsp:Transcript_76424/g.175097  ORF Transcript_76424/g.175097 Transcript_76424/m.175097 type:complete len:351 (-) Transcript_76424:247-1299(-)
MLAVIIKVFEVVYIPVAVYLNDLENHRTEEAHTNALVWKIFAFQAINYYAPFFYVILVQPHSTGCPEVVGFGADCVMAIRMELIVTLLALIVFRIAEVGLHFWYIRWQLESELAKVETADGKEVARSYMEEQGKYYEVRDKESIELHIQLLVSLGFVLLFGSVIPIVSVFALVMFVTTLRSAVYMHTHLMKRPIPRRALGIGPWQHLVIGLTVAGILMGGLTLSFHGVLLRDATTVARVSFCLAWFMGGLAVFAICTLLLPSEDATTALLVRRRAYVESRLHTKLGTAMLTSRRDGLTATQRRVLRVATVAKSLRQAENWAVLAEEKWEQIPHLDAGHPDWRALGPVPER